jgi:hypothetical protein
MLVRLLLNRKQRWLLKFMKHKDLMRLHRHPENDFSRLEGWTADTPWSRKLLKQVFI